MKTAIVLCYVVLLTSCGEVRVVDGSGCPVPGANVLLFGERFGHGETKTDKNGKFDFYNFFGGLENYRATISKAGYYSAEYFRDEPTEIVLLPLSHGSAAPGIQYRSFSK